MSLIQVSPELQKNLVLPPGQGYSLRKTSEPYRSFVVHTTNGKANTKFTAEANFLVNSKNVSAHYLISKEGVIEQILDPNQFVAWHTGEVSKDNYTNLYAIGVEVHFTPAELYWTGKMWAALTALYKQNASLELVTHRQIAVPRGRKIDPSGVTDLQFLSWRRDLNKAHRLATLRVNSNVRGFPRIANNVVCVYPRNWQVVVGADSVSGDAYNGSDQWYYCNWLGYVHSSLVELGEHL
jgi:N-acetyl-anhydromuramyl-L-alanine amidase AmpD